MSSTSLQQNPGKNPYRLGIQKAGLIAALIFLTTNWFVSIGQDQKRSNDWPQFHGPNRDNLSLETGLLKSWPAEGPALVWTARGLGHGFSSASVANGIICTSGNSDGFTLVTALDLDGHVLWRAKNGKAWTDSYPGSRGTPTIDGEHVYDQSPLGNIVCLNSKTGEIIWEKNIITEVNSTLNKWAIAESLLIDGEHLISCPGGPETSMVALDKHTGNIVWKAPSTNELAGYASPVLAEIQGMRIVMALTAKAIIGVNATTGELLWHVAHESYADENVMMPIYHEGCIFISTLATGSVKWKINVQNGQASLEEIWRTQELDNHHGGVVLINGYLYGTSTVKNKNQWVCLDWVTGEKKYAADGTGKGSMTYADGRLYTLSMERLAGLVKPSPTEFNVISTFEIPTGGEGLSWAHPVVCDGRLYIRHGEFLYAYSIR